MVEVKYLPRLGWEQVLIVTGRKKKQLEQRCVCRVHLENSRKSCLITSFLCHFQGGKGRCEGDEATQTFKIPLLGRCD